MERMFIESSSSVTGFLGYSVYWAGLRISCISSQKLKNKGIRQFGAEHAEHAISSKSMKQGYIFVRIVLKEQFLPINRKVDVEWRTSLILYLSNTLLDVETLSICIIAKNTLEMAISHPFRSVTFDQSNCFILFFARIRQKLSILDVFPYFVLIIDWRNS